MQVAYARQVPKNSYEGPRFARRKHWLGKLVTKHGGPKAVADSVGSQASHISAMVSGSRGVGDDLADRIEAACGVPNGYMDQPVDGRSLQEVPVVSAESLETWGAALLALPKEVRLSVIQMLGTYFSDPSGNADLIPLIVRRLLGELDGKTGTHDPR